jgi:hypothetical protein
MWSPFISPARREPWKFPPANFLTRHCKRLLLRDGTDNLVACFVVHCSSELSIMLFRGWLLTSPISVHCSALPSPTGH